MEGIRDNFCKACLFIFKNANTIECQGEATDLAKQSDIITEKSNCKFCMGVFTESIIPKVIERVLADLGNYDYEDYRIGTNFSPLYTILHHYVYKYLNIVENNF
jgi:tRNA U54 and U55 pseudouridine synthase Pus10